MAVDDIEFIFINHFESEMAGPTDPLKKSLSCSRKKKKKGNHGNIRACFRVFS